MPRSESERWPAGPPWGVALCLAQQKAKSFETGFVGRTFRSDDEEPYASEAKASSFRNLDVGAEAPTHKSILETLRNYPYGNIL